MVSIFVGFVSAYLSPDCLKLRRWSTNTRRRGANIMQPGKFLQIERGLMVHIRERRTDNMLLGIINRRSTQSKEAKTVRWSKVRSLKAEATASSCKRRRAIQVGQNGPTIVNFDTYGFDLSQYATFVP